MRTTAGRVGEGVWGGVCGGVRVGEMWRDQGNQIIRLPCFLSENIQCISYVCVLFCVLSLATVYRHIFVILLWGSS